MRKNQMIKTYRIKVVFTIFLSMAIMAQTVLLPGLSLAAEETATTSIAAPVSNPSMDIINQKLETVAKEKKIPSVILKAIAFRESSWRQFDSKGNPLLGSSTAHPAIGMMQVASYSDTDPDTIAKLKNDLDFNIQMGADLLNEKWRMVPKIGDGDRNKLENWYFAIWAYNCWDGRNNPNQAQTQTTQTTTTTTAPTTTNTNTNTSSTASTSLTSSSSSNSAPTSSSANKSATSSSSPSPRVVYQNTIIDLIAHPPSPLSKYIQPVEITVMPAASLPPEGVPASATTWQTPSPVHLADLGTTDQGSTGQGSTDPATKFTTLVRIAGSDPVDTSIQQAKAGWPQGASTVVIARSDDFPDALAGVPMAAQFDAPVLLTPPQELDSRVQKALQELHPEKVYLLGGEGALSAKVSSELNTLGWASGKQVRISGVNRYATAANISLSITGLQHSAVALTTGDNFPDALSIASVAGLKKMPVLLTSKTQIPQETLNALKQMRPSQVYLIGGEGVISSAVAQELCSSLNLASSSVDRLSGASRYDTMSAVGKAFEGDIKGLSFATGEDFPNALTGAALAVHQKQTLVLLPSTTLEDYPDLKGLITRHLARSETQPYISGDLKAIPQGMEEELTKLMQQ